MADNSLHKDYYSESDYKGLKDKCIESPLLIAQTVVGNKKFKMITFSTPRTHWNYYLAIESNLSQLSRYVEFADENLSTFSIELTYLLLSASSEVDVLMKNLCFLLDPGIETTNINDYKKVIKKNLPSFGSEQVYIDRYSLAFKPWENWLGTKNPDWWKSYNNVKHQRDKYYKEANLQNTVGAIGGLLVTVIFYYKLSFEKEAGHPVEFKDVTGQLQPPSSFLSLKGEYYWRQIVG